MTAHNLLTEPLIRFEAREGLERGSLADVFAALMCDRVESFPALRAHQEPAWHMFLAQLGAVACHRAGLTAPPEEAAAWAEIIGRLTRTEFPGDEPWCLVVNEWSKPAFLQPPVPEGVELKNDAPTPDALDMLITSRNHDLKQAIASDADVDDWVFALVSLQTMEGYGGPKNYGIARMNGAHSSRVLISLAPMEAKPGASPLRSGRRLARDVSQLLLRRDELLSSTPIKYRYTGGLVLTWTATWPDGGSLALNTLDIWFIEACRRVRLVLIGKTITGVSGNSSMSRINAGETKGAVGDPWAPISLPDPASLTLNVHGTFSYKRIVELLSPDWKMPLLAELGRNETDRVSNWLLAFQALARGQTKTGGFKSRVVPLKGRIVRSLMASRKEVHELATEQIGEIAKVADMLADAIGTFGRGGVYWRDVPNDQRRNEGEKQRKRAKAYCDRFDAVADRDFFPALWGRFEVQQLGSPEAVEDARRAFLVPLIEAARELLEEGLVDIPCPSIRRPRAEARARRQFESRLRSEKTGFPAILASLVKDDEEVIYAA